VNKKRWRKQMRHAGLKRKSRGHLYLCSTKPELKCQKRKGQTQDVFSIRPLVLTCPVIPPALTLIAFDCTINTPGAKVILYGCRLDKSDKTAYIDCSVCFIKPSALSNKTAIQQFLQGIYSTIVLKDVSDRQKEKGISIKGINTAQAAGY